MKIKLTKIAEVENPEVPNNQPVGVNRIGYASEKPKIGQSFSVMKSLSSFFVTSEVTEIIDDVTFRTKNSIYKIEYM